MWRLFILLLCTVYNSCGVKKTAETEKQSAFENCMLGKDISMSEEVNRKICNCWAEKIARINVNSNKSEVGVNAIIYDSYLQDCKTELVKK